jgi:hypothetical protein
MSASRQCFLPDEGSPLIYPQPLFADQRKDSWSRSQAQCCRFCSSTALERNHPQIKRLAIAVFDDWPLTNLVQAHATIRAIFVVKNLNFAFWGRDAATLIQKRGADNRMVPPHEHHRLLTLVCHSFFDKQR